MRKAKINRGAMRAARNTIRENKRVHVHDMPEQHPEKYERVKLNWSAPCFPGAFAHVLDVIYEHGLTNLRLCLENRKHIVFTLPLHDCYLTQHSK